jgi:hypothetical protein
VEGDEGGVTAPPAPPPHAELVRERQHHGE